MAQPLRPESGRHPNFGALLGARGRSPGGRGSARREGLEQALGSSEKLRSAVAAALDRFAEEVATP